MKGLKKNLLILGAFTAVCGACFAGGAMIEASAQTAGDYTFEMYEGASVRLSDNYGLRFRVTIGADLKDEITAAGDKVGMLILPYDYVSSMPAGTDYKAEFASGVIDLDLTDSLYEAGAYWYGNGVMRNIQEGNLTRDFVGIAYYGSETTKEYTYASFTEGKNVRSAAEVAEGVYGNYNHDKDSRNVLKGFLATTYADLDTTYAGLGTEASPYLIQAAEDFNYMATKVASSTTNTYASKYFRLENNLTGITGKVGKNNCAFAGTFDGNGKEIEIALTNANTSETHIGLFAYNKGTIKNLTITGTVTTTNANVGGVAGVNEGTLLNCTNKATVTGTFNLGGIVGQSTGATAIVESCNNYGEVTSTRASASISNGTGGGYSVGGIVGLNGSNATILSCKNYGTVTAVGGGAKSSVKLGVGGIVGASNQGLIKKCINEATIYGVYYFGGIIGYATKANITECTNNGDVLARATVGTTTITNSRYVGGIAGYGFGNDAGTLQLTGNTNTGKISAHLDLAQIYGYLEATSTDHYKIDNNTESGSVVTLS
ncbi:MAG: hypothetical protein IJY62_03720 [Clostridia bacterium]|nr:hypothetical protein [Clostridia bacterium]